MGRKLLEYQFRLNSLAATLRNISRTRKMTEVEEAEVECAIDEIHTRVYLSRLSDDQLGETFMLTAKEIDDMGDVLLQGKLDSLSSAAGTVYYHSFIEDEMAFRMEYDRHNIMRSDPVVECAIQIIEGLQAA